MKKLMELGILYITSCIIMANNNLRCQIVVDCSELVKVRIRSCVSIESIPDTTIQRFSGEPTKLGSGVPIIKNGKHYVVTNYHVIKSSLDKNQLLIGLNLKSGKIWYVPNIANIDTRLDIAVLELNKRVFRPDDIPPDKIEIDQAFVGISTFADSCSFSSGIGILIFGFPLKIGTTFEGNEPVVRFGMIAQGLTDTGTILIDGIASHGNSGSPVFSIKDSRFLGVVKSFPPDNISAYNEKGDLIANLPYNSGLTNCISSNLIWKLIP